MIRLGYKDLNHLIYLYLRGNNYILSNFFDNLTMLSSNDISIVIGFGDFIKSQLNYKIIDTDYKYLVSSAAFLVNLSQNNLNYQMDNATRKGILNLFREFIKIMTPIAIYLHIKYAKDTILTVNKSFEDLEDGSTILNLNNFKVSEFSDLDDLKVVKYFSSINNSFGELGIWTCDDYIRKMYALRQWINEGDIVL